jgi:uncharacterized protein (TIGR03435 family)
MSRTAGMMMALILASLCSAQMPSFEAASVRKTRSETAGRSLTPHPGARLSASNATVKMLILYAYQVMPHQISGGPDWLSSEGFDIEAKAADPTATQAQFRQMIRRLLAERFQLKVHTAAEERLVYLLVPSKSGTKLTEATSGESGASLRMEGPGRLTAIKATMPMFASTLTKPLQRQVIDETGLQGAYNFRLQFAPEKRPGKAGADDAATASDAPSIFTALDEQLGLNLKTARRPVEILVIDSAARPGPN